MGISLLLCGSAQAASVFPTFAIYSQGVNEAFFNVEGQFVDVDSSGTLSTNDELRLLLNPTESGLVGSPAAVSPNFAYAIGGTIDDLGGGAFGLAAFASGIGSQFNSAVNSATNANSIVAALGSTVDSSGFSTFADWNSASTDIEFTAGLVLPAPGNFASVSSTNIVASSEKLLSIDMWLNVLDNNLTKTTDFRDDAAVTPPASPTFTSELTFQSIAGIVTTGLSGGTATLANQAGNSTSGQVNPVPEPASILAMLGCVGFAGVVERRRRRRSIKS
ncbi:hypothetical protein N9222_02165 [Pseudomonadales bacterium]|nr:hypothetical protein [Pseudomonadales bacterium]